MLPCLQLFHTPLRFFQKALNKEDFMLHRTIWTLRRFTGIVLILGEVMFQGNAWIPLTYRAADTFDR